jgi:hypothetical protein
MVTNKLSVIFPTLGTLSHWFFTADGSIEKLVA